MNKIYLEWIDKAEGDYNTALREYRVRKNPNYDAVCIQAQQCIDIMKNFRKEIRLTLNI